MQLKEVRRRIERRRMLLGMAYSHIQEHELWRAGTHYSSLAQFCADRLDLDQRTLQRYAREGRSLIGEPEARRAIETGMTVDRALFAVERAWLGPSIDSWLDLAGRLDRVEMKRAEELEGRVDAAYVPAVGMAKQVEVIVASETATGIGATSIEEGGEAAAIAEHVLATRGATPIGTIRVALRGDPNGDRVGRRPRAC